MGERGRSGRCGGVRGSGLFAGMNEQGRPCDPKGSLVILILPPDIEILELARDTLVARFLTLKHWF